VSESDEMPLVEEYVGSKGWLDDGEEAAPQAVAPLIRSSRVLDIGVGTGRTVPLLALLTDDYVGVDFSDELVAQCRRNYPNKDIRHGDARNLAAFRDESFDFVLFNYNGIDCVPDDRERQQILREVHRVLDGGGLFVFSSLNKDGSVYAETPLQTHRPGRATDRSLQAAVRLAWRNGRDPLRLPRRYRNWRATRTQTVDDEGWGTSALASSDFTFIVHFTTLSRLREEVAAVGFEILHVFGSADGRLLPLETPSASDTSLYVVARKPASVSATPTGGGTPPL
jgi:SAM-dependent methyltransferase